MTPWLTIVGVAPTLQTHRTGALVLDNQLRPFVYRPFDVTDPPRIVTVARSAEKVSTSIVSTPSPSSV